MRRQNMASLLSSDGGMRSSFSLAKTWWSMKLFSGGSTQTRPGHRLAEDQMQMVATRCSNETRIVVSPRFCLTTRPSSSTRAIAGSVEL